MAWLTRKPKINLVYHYRDQGVEIQHGDRTAALAYLRDFVSIIRPSNGEPDTARENLEKCIRLLHEEPSVASNLRRAIFIHIRDANLVPMLIESGMALSRSMGRELSARLKHKFIPPLKDEKDFLQVIDAVFYENDDYEWVERIPANTWSSLLNLLGLSFRGAEEILTEQVFHALQVLSTAVAQMGWEREVANYLPMAIQRESNPFNQQLQLVTSLKSLLGSGDIQALIQHASRAKDSVDQCLAQINLIRENTQERGASLSQSFILYQMEQKLDRMLLLLDFLDADDRINSQRLAGYFMGVVRYENRKYSIREFLRQTTGYLAYQIAEQKGKKGNAYITSTPAEYRSMIFSAMKGGLIICFVAIFKNLLGFLKLAPFWQGFVYSLNYSAGFILIEETHSTLATKQPAFTANAVAGSLDDKDSSGHPRLYNLAVTIAKVSRSQFASFLGNLLVVFPGTYALAWLYHLSFGSPIAEGEQALQLLKGQHPWQSLSLLYACNTGFFLFLSGLIAGYVQNKMKFGRIGERIVRHPLLRFYTKPEKLRTIAHYWNHHAGTIVGSIALGFFLGMAGIVGKIFGIPFDIRHITIAAGNSSIGLYGVGYNNIAPAYLFTVFAGVLAIGLLNFLVSFSLSFIVAMRSRGLSVHDFPQFFGILWRYFKSNPLDFVRPRRRISAINTDEVT
ncbi:MAG: site-specific recombinase [Chitinophagaceae bacterium]|jgi:site-specific recombinase|nr:site-specific recombinase [Chitinophagaceae bacterium]